MQGNTTLSNMSQLHLCINDYETFVTVGLYTYIIISIFCFIGNLLVILIVYRNKNLRTSTNYFIVSMSVSDIFFPLFLLINHMFTNGMFPRQSKLVGNLLCKVLVFFIDVSFGVSRLTLVFIAIYRFSAVMFPLRARIQNKRKRFLVLLLSWVIPMAMYSPRLFYEEFDEQYSNCIWDPNDKQTRIWMIADLPLFHFLPVLILMVLYPLIIVKLKQHRVPGNVVNIQAVIRRRRQNFRLSIMFIVINVTFLLCWGPFIAFLVLFVIEGKFDLCNLFYLHFVSYTAPFFFHAINPVIYFIFLSSFRQGFKNIFCFSCCSRRRPQAPADNFELNNIPQAFNNN